MDSVPGFHAFGLCGLGCAARLRLESATRRDPFCLHLHFVFLCLFSLLSLFLLLDLCYVGLVELRPRISVPVGCNNVSIYHRDFGRSHCTCAASTSCVPWHLPICDLVLQRGIATSLVIGCGTYRCALSCRTNPPSRNPGLVFHRTTYMDRFAVACPSGNRHSRVHSGKSSGVSPSRGEEATITRYDSVCFEF